MCAKVFSELDLWAFHSRRGSANWFFVPQASTIVLERFKLELRIVRQRRQSY